MKGLVPSRESAHATPELPELSSRTTDVAHVRVEGISSAAAIISVEYTHADCAIVFLNLTTIMCTTGHHPIPHVRMPQIPLVEVQKKFLSSPKYAVVGASKDQSKFGTKVLKWYQARNIDVAPVHPKEEELEGFKTVRTIADLPAPTETSVHIITPPKVGRLSVVAA
ncbi:hypothetical protein NUW54_g9280 [Trametes sanguinea]|uniref:Uncharacterized protein n=1 Tax=Trametes sanguinea TaxID=158606 RepID=A0ACC1P7C6_9APHY|nr:hypothetical protein NUW54_g9280 [Trametes sanguinea]